ncbi:carboxypeptidase-like regulatory domain-containing protein [Granulicella sp. dw_53]|uniref:carboxypeptidase-like regulatory domain-containing protein n=1 Tax=Granulicella sp. dw_53 TaxID=2719792 RepID=UPI001BD575D5|nr:carboxypeptidase-like regulatory domain-containing protein [Granulicella sp. dw_53]
MNAATGLPIPRVLVRFNDRALLTDHEGKFEFDQVTDITVNLQITKPGFSTSIDPSDPPNQFFQLNQLTGPIELRLYPEALATGTVTDPNDIPLSNISVQALRGTYDELVHRWMVVAQAQTDLHGNFRLPVPAGDYKIETRYVARSSEDGEAVLPASALGPAAGSDSQVIHLRSGEERHFDLHPAVRRSYPVLLRMETGSEHGFPQITARTSDGISFNVGVVASRSPGRATIYLPSGTYKLSARIQNTDAVEIAETSVTVTGAETVLEDSPESSTTAGTVLRFVATPSIPVELHLDSSATSDNSQRPSLAASGVLTDQFSNQGSPTAMQLGLTLQRVDQDEGTATVNLMPARGGLPSFAAPPGRYRLLARGFSQWYVKTASYGSSDLLGQDLVVAASATGTTIHLLVSNQTGTLQGNAKLKGQVCRGCWIYLISSAPSATPIYTLRSNGNDGSYSRANLPPGSYQAIAFEHRYSAELADPAALASFSTYLQSVTVSAGAQSALDLSVVPQAEMQP